jgi:hypothetical protein
MALVRTLRRASSAPAVRRGLVAAVTVALLVAATVAATTGGAWPVVAAWTAPVAGLTFAVVVAVKSSSASVERAAAGRTLTAPLLVLSGALLGVVIAGALAFGPHGDVSIMDQCQGTALTAYFDPQPEFVDSLSDVNFGRFCNEDAVHKMHLVFGLLPISALAGVAGGVGLAHRWRLPVRAVRQS